MLWTCMSMEVILSLKHYDYIFGSVDMVWDETEVNNNLNPTVSDEWKGFFIRLLAGKRLFRVKHFHMFVYSIS